MKEIFKNAIVLTGGIATGKSTTVSLFKKYGLQIIDADKIAHDILDKNSYHISKLFGQEYIEGSKVIRKKLGLLVFSNKNMKSKLENFIHPLIRIEIENEANKLDKLNKPYLIDIPLFFETKSYDIKRSIVVYTTKQLQLKRLINRDQCDSILAQKKIDSQINIEEKRKLASYIIDNTKDREHLEQEVIKVLKDIR